MNITGICFFRSNQIISTIDEAVKTDRDAQDPPTHSKKVVGSSPASCNMSGLVPGLL